MKRAIFFTIIFSLLGSVSHGQLNWKMRRWEAMGGIGPSLFFCDIGGFPRTENVLGIRDMSFRQARFNINGNLKYRITREFNVRLSLTYGLLHGTDARGSNEDRAFEVSTSIFEPALIAEYYFLKNSNENSYLFFKGRRGAFKQIINSIDIYAFTGIGGASFKVNGNDALVNYGIESSGFTAVIPVGIGATLLYTPQMNLGLEIGGRYAFSDYLDGYTSQYSKANDVYYFVNFIISYKLRKGRNGLPTLR